MDVGAARTNAVPSLSLLPSLLTKQYRYDVLQLCQGSNTMESWATSQFLLDKCWLESPTPSTNNEHERIVHLCPQCGAWLHPGWQKSTLRVARVPTHHTTHQTRKRRVQRKKRRALLVQSKKAKEFHTNKAPGSSNATSNQSLESQVEQVLLREDSDLFLDRHHLVLRCGRCDAKIRIKGLKREVPPTKQMIQQNQVGKCGASVKRQDSRPLVSAPPVPSDQMPNALGDTDFLQLPPVLSKAKTTTTTTLSKHTPLHLRNPKKGKTKSPKGIGSGKDSKLLNFLSSLND